MTGQTASTATPTGAFAFVTTPVAPGPIQPDAEPPKPDIQPVQQTAPPVPNLPAVIPLRETRRGLLGGVWQGLFGSPNNGGVFSSVLVPVSCIDFSRHDTAQRTVLAHGATVSLLGLDTLRDELGTDYRHVRKRLIAAAESFVAQPATQQLSALIVSEIACARSELAELSHGVRPTDFATFDARRASLAKLLSGSAGGAELASAPAIQSAIAALDAAYTTAIREGLREEWVDAYVERLMKDTSTDPGDRYREAFAAYRDSAEKIANEICDLIDRGETCAEDLATLDARIASARQILAKMQGVEGRDWVSAAEGSLASVDAHRAELAPEVAELEKRLEAEAAAEERNFAEYRGMYVEQAVDEMPDDVRYRFMKELDAAMSKARDAGANFKIGRRQLMTAEQLVAACEMGEVKFAFKGKGAADVDDLDTLLKLIAPFRDTHN